MPCRDHKKRQRLLSFFVVLGGSFIRGIVSPDTPSASGRSYYAFLR